MSEALVPVVARREIAGPGAAAVALPEVIVDAGPAAVERFLEFFAAAIANDRTRAAYGRAAGRFLGWCAARGLGLRAIAPLHVAACIRTHPGSAPTVKQHLAAIRALCDWLVVHQVLPVNPAAAVRGPKRAGAGAWRLRSASRVHDELACLRSRATNARGVEQHGSRAGPSRPPTPAIRAERLRFGEYGVLELLRDASLDHLLGRDCDGFPGCWVTTGPRFALLQDELRDAGQRELAAILKLLLGQPLQFFEELPRVGALEADIDGSEMLDEMREQLGLAHFAGFGHRCFP